MDSGYGMLPKLPASEIDLIYDFVLEHRNVIDKIEIRILQNMIEIYQEERTVEARQNLKRFLLYLRRCVNPTPSPRVPTYKMPRYSLQPNYNVTPVKRPEVKFRRPSKAACHCHTCRSSGCPNLSPFQEEYRVSRRFSIFKTLRNFVSPSPKKW